jgi:putative acetyltransferase
MIRLFRQRDTDDLIEVWYRASVIAHHFVPKDFWAQERAAIRARYLPIAETYIYEEDGRLLGFISLLEKHIGGLFIDPEAQGRGIGADLVRHAASLHGALTVNAFKLNTKALGFYRRMGFVDIGEGVEAVSGCVEITLLRQADKPKP